jgi:hypothetical protein
MTEFTLHTEESAPEGSKELIKAVKGKYGFLGNLFAAGYDKASVLDVILGTSLKVLSNYTNHITDTPLDAAFQANVWAPAKSVAA